MRNIEDKPLYNVVTALYRGFSMLEFLNFINENIIWGAPMIAVFLFVGVFYTAKLRFANFTRLSDIFRATVLAKGTRKSDGSNLSPFQTLTAALATTLGTGNIVAVGAAVAIGGAGTVFWLILSAMVGMATCYGETVLGMKYREKKADGSYFGGAFFYIAKGLKNQKAGRLYAVLCLLASLGMGNMTQLNAMSCAVKSAFGVPTYICGIAGALFIFSVIAGGIRRFGKVTEKLVPIFSFLYIGGCLLVIGLNYREIPAVIQRIFAEAFDFKAGVCGIFGSVAMNAMSWGFRRGIFSNEAGLGTGVMLHCTSSGNDAEKQGLWAMVQVFFDTVIMCTLTALALLVTGADKIAADGTSNAVAAFSGVMGDYAGGFIAVCIAFFALTTASGWWVYGERCLEYLFGGKGKGIFTVAFIIAAFVGAVMKLETVWALADLLNGLMALPNLTAMLCLSGEVTAEWKDERQKGGLKRNKRKSA